MSIYDGIVELEESGDLRRPKKTVTPEQILERISRNTESVLFPGTVIQEFDPQKLSQLLADIINGKV